MGDQMKQVAKLIKLRGKRESERDGFLTALGGWDSHNKDITETGKIAQVDAAVASLEKELINEGVWDDVTVLMISDFGRTLTSNGLGTDHMGRKLLSAWRGNQRWADIGPISSTITGGAQRREHRKGPCATDNVLRARLGSNLQMVWGR